MDKIEEEIRKGDYTVGLNGVAVIANTFAQDFIIADTFGIDAIKNTFKRAFEEWKEDIRYLTALAIIMNHLGWRWYELNEEISKLYFGYWEKIDAFILDGEEDGEDYKYKNFTADEVSYFIRACD